MVQVDANNIEAICKQKLRLDSEAVLDSDNQRAVAVAVTQLQRSYEEAAVQGGDPAVLDPVADLKLNQLEVVDSVRERQRLMQVSSLLPSSPPPPNPRASSGLTQPIASSPFCTPFLPVPLDPLLMLLPALLPPALLPPSSPAHPHLSCHSSSLLILFVSLTAFIAVYDTQMPYCLCNTLPITSQPGRV